MSKVVQEKLIATGGIDLKSAAPLDPMNFGAVGDGGSHPLSGVYSTLAEAQAVYPMVTSLTQERDWAALELLRTALPTGELKELDPTSEGDSVIKYRRKNGGKVRWGNRQYNLGTSSLKFSAGATHDCRGSFVLYSGTGDAFVRDESGPSTSPYTFWKCNIEGATIASTYTRAEPNSGGRHAINFLRLSESLLTDILVFGFRDDAVVLPEAQFNTLTDIKGMSNGGHLFRVGDSVALETSLTAEATAEAATLQVGATVTVTTGLEARVGSYYGEQVSYTGKTAESLTGCVRGIYGSRARSWPPGTPVYIMSNQRSNNNTFVRCLSEANARGGLFCDFGHANSWGPTNTMQFSAKETKLTEELTVPGNLNERTKIKVESTEGWAPTFGWGFLTKTAGSEFFTYESKTATEFIGVMRGMKGSSAAVHTVAGTSVRKGTGVHFRGHDNFRNLFEGHLEGNTCHAFIEADNITAESERGMPRGARISAFYVASNKCERFVINQGEGTELGGTCQSNIEENLSRNNTKVPFEFYQTNTNRNCTPTFINYPLITAPANFPLFTDQTGFVDNSESQKAHGSYIGGALVLGLYNEPLIYIRLNNGSSQQIMSMGESNLLRIGQTATVPLLVRGKKLELGATEGPVKLTNNSTKLGTLNGAVQLPDINTSGKTSAEITTAYEAIVGITLAADTMICDKTNKLMLVYSGTKWLKTAALTEIA